MFFELDRRGRPCCAGTATSSATRPRTSAGSPRSRSRRRCRSSQRTATATRSWRSSSCWSGPLDEGETILKPLRDVARRSSPRCVGPMPYPALNSRVRRARPPGLQHYWKANFVTELTDEAIEAHLEHGPEVPAVNSTMHIYPINGACHRVAPDDDRLRPPGRELRDGDRGHVAGPGRQRGEHRSGCATTTTPPPRTPRTAGYINFMADDDQDRDPGELRTGTTTGSSRSSAPTTPTTCST